ncbi:transcriptional regulator [candidate division KSB1 bacterium]|nr:transcriptional regulator [candidate division KSB1 bacterium]
MSNTDDVIDIFAEIHDVKTMRHFFNEILTPSERETIQLRWDLMKRLYEGQSQRGIASELGISLCKITRGSKILKDKNSISSRILNNKSSENNSI